MKRFFVIVLAVFLFGALLYAGSVKEGGNTSGTQQKEISIIWWGSQNRHDRTIKVIKLYMELNPDVKIIYEFAGWSNYWTKVTIMAAGGQLPDIMQQDYGRLAVWQAKNLLSPLDEFNADGTIDTTNISDNALSGGRIGGKLYGMNLGMNSLAFILDVDAFKKAGIPLPAQNWTWDDFDTISKELYAKLGIYGMGGGIWGSHMLQALYLGNGDSIYAADGKSLGYSDDSIFTDYMTMLKGQIAFGAYPKHDVEISEYAGGVNPEQSPIVASKSAMACFWSNQLAAVVSASGEGREFELTHLPRLKRNGPASNYLKPSQFFSITSHSKNPDEAARFIDFISNSIEANKILFAERGVPVSSAIREALLPLLDENTQKIFKYIDRVAADSSAIPKPDPLKNSEIMSNVYGPLVIDPVAFNEITPAEGVAILRKEATKILQGQ